VARRTFFSFHYANDIWRASQVRNSNIVKTEVPAESRAGFVDASLWEETKKEGETAIRRMIDDALKNTSVTCVLIGQSTSTRPWVRYEIKQSFDRGSGLLGVYVHKLKDQSGSSSSKGVDPFVAAGISNVPTYDWVDGNGYLNLAKWVGAAPSKKS